MAQTLLAAGPQGGETIRAAAVMTAFLVLPSDEEVGRVPLP